MRRRPRAAIQRWACARRGRCGRVRRRRGAVVGDQTLHYVEAGDGPLVVLLHGFPEFWFGWRLQIEPLAAGLRAGLWTDPAATAFDPAGIPSGVGEALSKYLDRLPNQRQERDRELLTALAYARGERLLTPVPS